MNEPRAVDTSVAVPLLVETHPDHATVVTWRGQRQCVLSGHALVETYSVLTRLPASLRVPPDSVAESLEQSFEPPLALSESTGLSLPRLFAAAGIVGGAVYDALVGLAAREHGFVLATRDARAKRTYDALGVEVELVA